MDPVSAVGLITVISNVLTEIYSYGKAVNQAPNDVAQLRSELFALKAALEHITWDGSHSELTGSKECLRMLQEAQITLYSLLDTLKKPQSKSKQKLDALVWPFKLKDVLTYVSHLERIKTYFVLLITSDNFSLNQKVFDEVLLLRKDIEKLQISQQTARSDAHRQLLRQWLSPCDPSASRDAAISKVHGRSGQWFLNSTCSQWIENPSSFPSTLWLHGKPGSGKTTLLSLAIRQLLNARGTAVREEQVGIAYFYCSLTEEISQQPLNLVGSLLNQLCDQYESYWQMLEERYTPSTSQRPTLEQAIALLKSILHMFSRTILVIDGMNESSEGVFISELCSSLCLIPGVVVMASSTDEFLTLVPIETRKIFSLQKMDHGRVQDDISSFIEAFFLEAAHLSRLPRSVQTELKNSLLSKADGSFQWIQCQLEAVSTARSVKDIRHRIANIPRSLEDMYLGILDSVPPADCQVIRTILLWLTFSLSPLQLEEISTAAVFDGSTEEIDPDSILFFPEKVLSSCKSFLHYDSLSKRYSLAHSSVREFLTSEKLKNSHCSYFYLEPSTCLATLARYCLAYFCLPAFEQGFDESRDLEVLKQNFPLYEYASARWSFYTTRVLKSTEEKDEEDVDSERYIDVKLEAETYSWLCCACGGDGRAFLALRCPDCKHYMCERCRLRYQKPTQVLSWISNSRQVSFSQEEKKSVLEAVLLFFATANKPNAGNFGQWFQVVYPRGAPEIWSTPPLYVAAREGLTLAVEAILKKEGGRHLETPGGRLGSTPLHVACYYGNISVVKILLDAGANPSEKNKIGTRGIEFARAQGNATIVDLLEKAKNNRDMGI